MRTSLVSAGIGTVRKEGGLNSSVSACVAACFRGTIPFCPPYILLFHCFEFALALVTSEGVAAGLPPPPFSPLFPLSPPFSPLSPLFPHVPSLPPLPPLPRPPPPSPPSSSPLRASYPHGYAHAVSPASAVCLTAPHLSSRSNVTAPMCSHPMCPHVLPSHVPPCVLGMCPPVPPRLPSMGAAPAHGMCRVLHPTWRRR
ncbi:unnamed protein product, partial [Closterium sp. NIES-65]